nr:MAG TPA: hypothetical protein [Caudoviricetes sp.]
MKQEKDLEFAKLVIRLGRVLPFSEVEEMTYQISKANGREAKEKVVYAYANKYGIDLIGKEGMI